MNERVNESFSAFLDGEASEMDIQRMLKALDKNPEVLDDWRRLSRAQAALAGDVLVDVDSGPEAGQPGSKPVAGQVRSRWRVRFGQGALAAAVAVVVVTAAQWPFGAAPTGNERRLAGDPEASQAHFEVQQRLNSYLRQHAEAASYSSGHVVVPHSMFWKTHE